MINELQSVMGVDGLTTSHPINQPVHHPDEINQIFDRISYNKGKNKKLLLFGLKTNLDIAGKVHRSSGCWPSFWATELSNAVCPII